MASTIRIKKRASSGSAGAPSSLASSELAFNENASDKKLYYGYGDNGSGVATSIITVGGSGAFCDLTTAQTVAGNKTFSDNLVVSGNLTVNGTTTSIQTTNSVVKDGLIELGNGTSGTPSNDSGLVIERGSSANAFIGWDESADKFIVGTGTFTGADTGNLSITSGTLVASTFEGNLTGNVTGNTSGSSGSCTGNAATATTLANARTIGGTSFDGSANIAVALAATATTLATARTIAGVSFDGSANISLNNNAITNGAGYITSSGSCATATSATNSTNSTHVYVTDNESTDENNLITFVENANSSTGNVGLEMDGNLYYNPNSGTLAATYFAGTIDGGTW